MHLSTWMVTKPESSDNDKEKDSNESSHVLPHTDLQCGMYSYSASKYMLMAYMVLEQQLEECCSTDMFELS